MIRYTSIDILVLFTIGVALRCLTGCAPQPRLQQAPVASWVGDKQDSGVEVVNGSGRFAPATRDAYNALIVDYGKRFYPAMTFDEGITPGAPDGWYYANHFARVHFFIMNGWRTSAMHPPESSK
jgi:hypothetical protein